MGFELTINNVAKPLHNKTGFNLSWRLGGRGTFRFQIHSLDGTYEPPLGSEAKLWLGGSTIWAGCIQRIKTTAMYGSCQPGTPSISECDAITHESRLDKRIVRRAVYLAQTCGDIVTDILNVQLAHGSPLKTELNGYTTDIQAGVTIDKYVIDCARASDILDDLAARSGYCWFVDEMQNLYFIPRVSSPALYTAPFTITDLNPNCREVSVERSLDGFRDQQYIRISYAAFDPRDQSFVGDGATQQWTLLSNDSPPVDSLVNYVERITVSEGSPVVDVEKTFGIYNIDSDRDFYYSVGEPYIWQDAAGVLLESSNTLNVRWRQLGSDVMVIADDPVIFARALVEVGTGIHDHMIDDSSEVDSIGHLAKAQAILDAKKIVPIEVSGETDVDGLRPGQILTVALSVPNITSVVLIDSVEAWKRSSNSLRYKFHGSTAAYDDWVSVWNAALSKSVGYGGLGFVGGSSTGGGVIGTDPVYRWKDHAGADDITIDFADGDNHSITLDRASTNILEPIYSGGAISAGRKLTIRLVQDGTSGRVVVWNAIFLNLSQPTIDADTWSKFPLIHNGTNWEQDGPLFGVPII